MFNARDHRCGKARLAHNVPMLVTHVIGKSAQLNVAHHTFVSVNLDSISSKMLPLCSVSSANPSTSAMISESRHNPDSVLQFTSVLDQLILSRC